jgi:hypothetical protein
MPARSRQSLCMAGDGVVPPQYGREKIDISVLQARGFKAPTSKAAHGARFP